MVNLVSELTGVFYTSAIVVKPKPFARLRRPWAPEEDNQLREMAGAGKSIIMIALKLERTVLTLRGRASILKVAIRAGKRKRTATEQRT
jgi:hypothetical protein